MLRHCAFVPRNFTSSRWAHSSNVHWLIFLTLPEIVTLVGIVTLASDVQLKNAPSAVKYKIYLVTAGGSGKMFCILPETGAA